MGTNSVPLIVDVASKLSRVELNDQDILVRLTNTEDSTVERKTASDYRDCLKTAVAFSNSLPVDDPGIIFVGVGNDGTVQDGLNLDALQKDVSKELSKIYPSIYPQMKVMRDTKGREFVALIVRGSENRPHFAGPSYVRKGSETVEASEEQFAELIARRNSKADRILSFKGKGLTVVNRLERLGQPAYESQWPDATVVDCNQFWLTLENPTGKDRHSFPLSRVELNFDNARNRLLLEITR